MRHAFIFVTAFLVGCTVVTQVPISEISISVQKKDQGIDVISILNESAIREGLYFSAGTVKVTGGRGDIVNAMVEDQQKCTLAVANSSASLGQVRISFFECPGFDYLLLKKRFMDAAEGRGLLPIDAVGSKKDGL